MAAMKSILDQPMDRDMQAAVDEANIALAQIADRRSLPASKMVLVLIGLLAAWAGKAHDDKHANDISLPVVSGSS